MRVLFMEGPVSDGAREFLYREGYKVMSVGNVDTIKQVGGGLPNMTLRQYYVGQCVNGAMNLALAEIEAGTLQGEKDPVRHVAKMALELADALITEEANHA